mmetsp:Transcript_22446/g.32149  ORF Transcript_22446/g.32149 Transcript_22446/m.32149 type:complete len:919 (-) Transcript_22446:249-3005(-)
MSFGGMGCPTFHAQHVADKIVLFLHHMKENAEIAEVMKASMSLTQLECGISIPFFGIPTDPWYDLVTPTWLNHIWYECSTKNIEIQFHDDHFWVPSAQRENDVTIMDLADQMFGGTHIQQINKCRLALQVTYISDITSVDGKRILQAYYDGKGHTAAGRKTRLNWPPIGELPACYWTTWREFLNRIGGTSLRLPTSLGAWYQDSEIPTQLEYYLYEHRLLANHGNEWYELQPYLPQSRTRYALDPVIFTDLHLLSEAKVVDVTKRGDSIYIVSQSHQRVVPSQIRPPVTTIQQLYTALPFPLQRLMGHIEWPDEATTAALAEAIRQGQAVGASVGSVRATENKASHAWIIQAPNGAEIIGKGPVDGSPQNRTSHRAVLQGQTGIILMVTLLVKFYSVVSGHIATFCDNKPVVTKIQKGWDMLRLRHTKGPDTDLQATMRELIEQLQGKCSHKTTWVQSHQDKSTPLHSLPKEAALNIRMDQATKDAYELPPEWHTRESIEVLPAEGCAIYISNQKITSSLHPTILDSWKEAEAREYLLTRHDIDADLFQSIHWGSLKFALKQLNHHRRATAVKAIHRHLPTQDKLFKQNRVTMCALCPRCMSTPETNAHVYACPNQEATKQRLKDFGELQKQLIQLSTATVIQQVWAIHLRRILALPTTADLLENIIFNARDEVSFLLQAAIKDQERIGWHKLLLGMGSSFWHSLQHHIDTNNPKPPSRNASDWMNRAIHHMLKLSLRCWKFRNTTIHGETAKEQKQKALERTRSKISAMYANPPKLAPQFDPITAIPLAQRLRLSFPAAEKWIAKIEHQMKVTAHNLRVLLRQHLPFSTLVSNMAEERRKQLAWQSKSPSQDTPKRAHGRRTQNDVKAMRFRLYRSITEKTFPQVQSTARSLFQPARPIPTKRHKTMPATTTRYHPP